MGLRCFSAGAGVAVWFVCENYVLCFVFRRKVCIFVDVIWRLDGLVTLFREFYFVFCFMNTGLHP